MITILQIFKLQPFNHRFESLLQRRSHFKIPRNYRGIKETPVKLVEDAIFSVHPLHPSSEQSRPARSDIPYRGGCYLNPSQAPVSAVQIPVRSAPDSRAHGGQEK